MARRAVPILVAIAEQPDKRVVGRYAGMITYGDAYKGWQQLVDEEGAKE